MIKVTRLDGRQLIVNADLIEEIEETPDTIISFTTGRKIMVRETLDEVLNRVMEYRSRFPVYAVPAGGEGWRHHSDIHEEDLE
ncbi:MAG: flagellar FlbD family protein [Bacteroidales bacterium]|nr:flagellar FlbD family protein [Candidatus Latescibacterota bacterium]